MALMYLSGFLKKHGLSAKVIDITFKDQIRDKNFYQNKERILENVEDATIQQVENWGADIVGITCYTPELDQVQRLARRLKTKQPQTKIIVGGIHPTLYPEDFLGPQSFFDFTVIGEGEATLLELVKAIRANVSDYQNIKSIAYFNKSSGQNVVTPPRPVVLNLDEITSLDYEDIDMDFYTTASPYAIRGVFVRSFYILSSRGCPSSCTFCVSKKLRDYHGIQHFVRLRSAQALYREICLLRDKYSIDAFYFIDDLFTLKKENVREFCGLMVKNKIPLIWGCSSKVNTVDEETLKLMKEAGCVQIDFGVEKGSDEALKNLKKGINIRQIRGAFDSCRHLGIRTFANLLVNTPGETEDDLTDIIDMVRKIKPTVCSFNVFTPYPGCEIFDHSFHRFQKEDFSRMMEDPNLLIKQEPNKFRFANHQVDLERWTRIAMKKYNHVLPNLLFFCDPRYLKSLLFSKRKFDYLKQLGALIREFIVQKF